MAAEPYVWDGKASFYHSPTSRELMEAAASAGTLHGDGPPTDGVTGLGETQKLYQNDSSDYNAGEAVLYVNIDPTSPSEAPVWRGVVTL
jgi:hypothetical protein